MEENNNEIGLIDLWNRIWKNKFLIIIITAVLVIIGTVFLYFSNKSGTVIKTDFKYDFLNATGEKYPDGTRFDYRNIFSINNLEVVKETNSDFDVLDSKKLSNDNNAGIKKMIDSSNKEEGSFAYFEITIPVKYFNNNHDLTKEFIKALHANVIKEAKDRNGNFAMHNYFNPSGNFFNENENYKDLTYLELIGLIDSQISLIDISYNHFKDAYGNVHLDDGKRIEDMYLELKRWLNQDVRLDLLEDTILNKSYYINFERTKKLSTLKYEKIENEIILNELIIEELTKLYKNLFENGTLIGGNELAAQIATKVEENLLLIEANKYYDKFKNATTEPDITAESEAFRVDFFSMIDQLSSQVENFNEYYNKYLDENTIYQIIGDREFATIPKHNLILMIIVLGMLGGIIGVTTALIKESINNKENKNEVDLITNS